MCGRGRGGAKAWIKYSFSDIKDQIKITYFGIAIKFTSKVNTRFTLGMITGLLYFCTHVEFLAFQPTPARRQTNSAIHSTRKTTELNITSIKL